MSVATSAEREVQTEEISNKKSSNFPFLHILIPILLTILILSCLYLYRNYQKYTGKKQSTQLAQKQETTNSSRIPSNYAPETVDTCGVTVFYPHNSFTKTTLRDPRKEYPVENLYKWKLVENNSWNSVNLLWGLEKPGFDPSAGEFPQSIINIRCLENTQTFTLKQFKDYVLNNSVNIEFTEVKNDKKWGTDIIEITYQAKEKGKGKGTVLLNDMFIGEKGMIDIFRDQYALYIVSKNNLRNYWPDEEVVESNVNDLTREMDSIFDYLQFSHKEYVLFQHYTNEYIPGFEITYDPRIWTKEEKQFSDIETKSFNPEYLSECGNHCMGVRFKKSSVSLELIFTVAFDDFGLNCSNTVEYHDIGNKWYRIKDSEKQFYSHYLRLNYSIKTESSFSYLPNHYCKDNKDWQCEPNKEYKICDGGTGTFLPQRSMIEEGSDGKGVPIMLEKPVILGNPDENTINEIDNMIRSIKLDNTQ